MANKKDKFDSEHYINEIDVLEWLKCNDPQKIRFKDRIEYKLNNKLHREDGFAIEYFDGAGNQYFINGEKMEPNEYKNFTRTKMIDKMIDK